MNFNMKKPCANCPFRNDKPEQDGWLGEDRAEEIAASITVHQQSFPCHKTTIDSGEYGRDAGKDSEHCAGALIMLEKMDRPNQMMRISERLGMYDRNALDMDSPVFDNSYEFVEAHT